ncbi:MAG: phosphate acyltransferase PlsX [Candidatus Marinimicrobia bacterium]|nr:phosphate acyltransferase PlsX [Candidatus Neomarinimicrobiota bacterium]
MRIIIDAMGGDNAPLVNIEGALLFLQEPRAEADILLVGDDAVINAELAKHSYDTSRIRVVHASQVVEMGDSPTRSFKEKPDSSLRVGLNLLKKGEGDAFLSAGNTGAVMAYSLLTLGRIQGVDRPCVGAFLPHHAGTTLMLDVGAVSEVKPKNLLQFGIMGTYAYQTIMKFETRPRVSLLSIGEEEEKGTSLVKAAYRLLEESSAVNFTGYCEGRDIFTDQVDIVVTDGFTGNVALKLAESAFTTLFNLIRTKIHSIIQKLGAGLLMPVFNQIRQQFDPNNYGGSPLLGVKGISLICHGNSNSNGIKNAIREAQRLIRSNLLETIENGIRESQEQITFNPMDDEIIRH